FLKMKMGTKNSGVKFAFEVEERVLCFEPDPSKARVLYEAKVLELKVGRDSNGRRKPDYLIHFQGWNSSWDRIVPECFILKFSDENRALARRLAVTARGIRKNKARKRKIDDILREVKKRPRYDSESSLEEEDDDDDGESDGETFEARTDTRKQTAEYKENDLGDIKLSGEQKENIDSTGEKDDVVEPREVELPIPDNLKKILEEDCNNIVKERKVVNIPAEHNIISLLEGYVRHYAINTLCQTNDTKTKSQHGRDTRSVHLCKEVMDGLRVYFDFTLPVVLLYNFERAQYAKVSTLSKPIDIKQETSEPLPSPRTRRTSARLHSPSSPVESLPTWKPKKGAPKSKKRQIEKEAEKEEESEAESEDEKPTRRITRRSLAIPPDTKQTPAKDTKRSKSDHKSEKSDSKTEVSETTKSERKKTRLSMNIKTSEKDLNRTTPPLAPLQIGLPSTKSSHGSSSPAPKSHTSSAPFQDGMMSFSESETVLNDVLSWKLLPSEVYHQVPATPSVMYGAQHLLRLFVHLPGLLERTSMPEPKLKSLTRHLELFLEYLSTKADELFPEGAYVSADSTSNNSNSKLSTWR
ncbi:unnamed protein product, partial [Owenia fusiformis]